MSFLTCLFLALKNILIHYPSGDMVCFKMSPCPLLSLHFSLLPVYLLFPNTGEEEPGSYPGCSPPEPSHGLILFGSPASCSSFSFHYAFPPGPFLFHCLFVCLWFCFVFLSWAFRLPVCLCGGVRSLELELETLVSCRVGAGNWDCFLLKNSQCS